MSKFSNNIAFHLIVRRMPRNLEERRIRYDIRSNWFFASVPEIIRTIEVPRAFWWQREIVRPQRISKLRLGELTYWIDFKAPSKDLTCNLYDKKRMRFRGERVISDAYKSSWFVRIDIQEWTFSFLFRWRLSPNNYDCTGTSIEIRYRNNKICVSKSPVVSYRWASF